MVGLVGTIGFLRGRLRRLMRREGAGTDAGAGVRVVTAARSQSRARFRVGAVVLALLAVQLGSLVAPAYACACGALVPGDERQLTVGREVSVVRWDGTQEQIVMRLTVSGDAERAAWIMPVPRRATVTLDDPELFDQLAEATAPVQRTRYHFWPQDGDWPLTAGDGAGGPPPPRGTGAGAGVGVVGRERLGPFDVARLTATDPGALDDWLRANDFVFPPRLEGGLQPYVDRNWEYVAVRLAPETAGTPLSGELEPLRLSFASDDLVYPMRLSRLASTPQSLGLYVLAAHRMEPASAIGGERPRVTFAGRLGTTTGPLKELATGTPYLTAVAQEFPLPSAISGDHELRRAANDTPFQQVIYENRLLTLAGIPAWLLTVVIAVAALGTGAIVLGVRRGRTRRTGPSGPRHASGYQGGEVLGGGGVPGGVGVPGGIGGIGSSGVPEPDGPHSSGGTGAPGRPRAFAASGVSGWFGRAGLRAASAVPRAPRAQRVPAIPPTPPTPPTPITPITPPKPSTPPASPRPFTPPPPPMPPSPPSSPPPPPPPPPSSPSSPSSPSHPFLAPPLSTPSSSSRRRRAVPPRASSVFRTPPVPPMPSAPPPEPSTPPATPPAYPARPARSAYPSAHPEPNG
ncbi:DUF2330 domain-containing protein [Streptomyces sp. NBC_01275]|uniref:DUF2330 domain-containing protein n=1 Tax=Streptomyces sp. NBC_01275 TaxID=2903807 RepID=UPI002B1CEFCF|nr:DUF2330 domain-containing protein [Streptomyces sp. NBC_01275]